MFCSVQCRNEAMQSFHKYECAAVDAIKKITDVEITYPIRLILSLLALFDGDTEALRNNFVENAENDITVYTKRLTPFKFALVYCMINANQEKDSWPATIERCLSLILRHCKAF